MSNPRCPDFTLYELEQLHVYATAYIYQTTFFAGFYTGAQARLAEAKELQERLQTKIKAMEKENK